MLLFPLAERVVHDYLNVRQFFLLIVEGAVLGRKIFNLSRQLRFLLLLLYYLPHVRDSQPQARDISLPKLYNVKAVA